MIPERIAPGIFFAQEHDMADENLNDAPEENANTNAAPSENAQQALDDLTVLSDVGNQSPGRIPALICAQRRCQRMRHGGAGPPSPRPPVSGNPVPEGPQV
uniref:Uncharacterized protein n=1 Tax=Magnetospirillum gryphiswaldense TaxID=55518 RepID=A4TTN0_9PROT|nr:hypothetical protein MGR_1795 [Magnetospirillum gryphiswaldense MSR-1]